MPRILLKRGLKNNLPVLSSGEPAFTTDTKELFIGSTEGVNVAFSRENANLIVNGNFLRVLTNLDSAGLGLSVGSSAFAFGNFYFTNQAGSAGNLGIQRATDNSGKINITAANASPTVEYREKYPRVLLNENNYLYKPYYDQQKMTLSFDYAYSGLIPINFQCGCPAELISGTIAAASAGRFLATFNFTSAMNAIPAYPVFDLIIFKCLTPFTSIISIGNIKAELGSVATPFRSASPSLTSALLERQYYERAFSTRASYLTVANVQTNIGDITNATVYLPKVSVPYYKLYNIAGALQTGFSLTVTLNAASGLAELLLTKAAHGLLDAYISGTMFVDNRPYGTLT